MPLPAAGSRGAMWITAAALGARVAYLFAYGRSPLAGGFFSDQLYYRDWAMRIAGGDLRGEGVFEQGPLYAYLLGAFYRLAGPRDTLALSAQLLLGVVTVTLIWLCARRLFGRGAALAAGLLAALYGPAIYYECQIMKSFLEPLLVVSTLYSSLRYAEARRAWWLAAAAALAGLACLVREIHILLLLPLLILAVAVGRGGGARGVRRALFHAFAALAAFALVLAPSALRNHRVSGELVAVTSGGGEVLYIAFGPYATGYYTVPPFVRPRPHLEHQDFRDEAMLRTGRHMTAVQSSRYWLGETMRLAASSPGRTLKLALSKGAIFFNDLEVPDSQSYRVTAEFVPLLRWLPTFGWACGLGCLGILVCLARGREAFLPPGFAAVLLAEGVLSYNFGRFRMGLAPLWLLMAGAGASWLVSSLFRTGGRGSPRTWAAAVLAALATAVSFLPPGAVNRHWQANYERFRERASATADHSRAASLLRREAVLRPGDPALLFDLGTQMENLGRLHEAVESYGEALRLDPEFGEAHWRLANIAYGRGDLETAVEHGRAYAGLRPESPEGHTGLAIFCSRKALDVRDPAEKGALLREAHRHFGEARRLDPDDPVAFYYEGKMSALAGNVAEAVPLISAALRLAPGFEAALHLLELLTRRREG